MAFGDVVTAYPTIVISVYSRYQQAGIKGRQVNATVKSAKRVTSSTFVRTIDFYEVRFFATFAPVLVNPGATQSKFCGKGNAHDLT